MIGWLIWAWSNLAFVGALAGLVAVWWFLTPKTLRAALLITVSAAIGGFGWGEKRYVAGREDAESAIRRQAVKETKEFVQKVDKIATEKQEADQEASSANKRADEALRKAQEAASDADDAQTSADIIADLEARLEVAQGLVDDLSANLGEVPECKPKYITKTIRKDCQQYKWPASVVDAIRGVK